METFSALLTICAGNSPVPGEFPAQRPVTRSFDVFFDLRLNKRLSNNREAGDLRHYRAHYDVTVMSAWILTNHGETVRRSWTLERQFLCVGYNTNKNDEFTLYPIVASYYGYVASDFYSYP